MVICIYFSSDKSLLLVRQWKKNIFSGKANIKKFILPLEKYLKTLIGTAGT